MKDGFTKNEREASSWGKAIDSIQIGIRGGSTKGKE
jgi:hypothetical protein